MHHDVTHCPDPDLTATMSQDDNLIDFASERSKRIHDINDKRLNDMRQVFEQVMPLGAGKKKPKKKPKKR